jgi:hypothetical protein
MQNFRAKAVDAVGSHARDVHIAAAIAAAGLLAGIGHGLVLIALDGHPNAAPGGAGRHAQEGYQRMRGRSDYRARTGNARGDLEGQFGFRRVLGLIDAHRHAHAGRVFIERGPPGEIRRLAEIPDDVERAAIFANAIAEHPRAARAILDDWQQPHDGSDGLWRRDAGLKLDRHGRRRRRRGGGAQSHEGREESGEE